MGRKTATVSIDTEDRDQGKLFKLTEMPAYQAERWAMRALMALCRANPEVPPDITSLGMAGIAQFGLTAFARMEFAEAGALLDEMMGCIKILPSSKHPGVERDLFEGDIEEISTLLRLRVEVFKLHVDFSKAAGASSSVLAALKGMSS